MANEVISEVAVDMLVSGDFHNTIESWKEQLARYIYLYQALLKAKKKKINRINLFVLIFSTIVTLISSTQFGVDKCTYTDAYLTLQVLATVFSLISSVLSGSNNIYRFTDEVDNIQKHIDSMEDFYSLIISREKYPENFIETNQETWDKIIRLCPPISTHFYITTLNKYERDKAQLVSSFH